MDITFSFDPEFTKLMNELFIKFPECFRVEGIHPDQLDINKVAKSFFTMDKAGNKTADVSIDANANVSGKDTITYSYELAKPTSKLNSLYNLWSIIRDRYGSADAALAVECALSGFLYINDGWDIGRPYCFNYSTYDIALNGLKMSKRLNIAPPKSLASFLRQVEQFTVYAANSTLGATGLADLLIVASWYVHKMEATGFDNHVPVDRDYLKTYVKELFTALIYTLNWEFRGNQSPFTNVSVYDNEFLKSLCPSYIIDGQAVDIPTVDLVQRWFLECMNETLERTPITFPVITACFSVTEYEEGGRDINDETFCQIISEANLKHGFINIYMGKSSTLSSCCRLRSESEGLGYSNSFGAGSTKIGSMGVVTLNLPRMARMSINDDTRVMPNAFEDFLFTVKGSAFTACVINDAKRTFIKDRIKRGALPLYDLGYMSLDRQYSTVGFTGLYEAVTAFGYDFTEPDGIEAAKAILSTIREACSFAHDTFGTPHNMEQVPAESSAVKLAEKDRILGILDEVEDADVFYSNQFIPLTADVNVLTRMEVQGELDPYCDGGSILHINTKQPITDKQRMGNIIKMACSHGVVYFAINYVLKQCPDSHLWTEDTNTCPVCGKEASDLYTRVVGFLTNTKHWNKKRREHDFPHRKFY